MTMTVSAARPVSVCSNMRLLTDTAIGRLILVVGSPLWAALLCLIIVVVVFSAITAGILEYIRYGAPDKERWQSGL